MGRHGIVHFSVAFGSVKSGGRTRQPFPSFHSIAAPVLFGCLDENSPHLDNPSGLLWCCPLVFKKATKLILRLDWFRGQLPLVSILQKNREMKTKQSRQTYRPCGVETLVFPCSFNHGSWGNSHGEGFLNSLSNGTSGNCLLVKGRVMLSWVRCPGVGGLSNLCPTVPKTSVYLCLRTSKFKKVLGEEAKSCSSMGLEVWP